MYTNPYRRLPNNSVIFRTSVDFSRREQHRKLPESMDYLESYLDGSFFITAHSLGEIAGLSKANTTRLSGSLANYSNRNANTIGSMFSLPAETVLFYTTDKKPKTTRHINTCAIAAMAIVCSEKPHAPTISGLGCNIVQPLLEGLASYPEATQQCMEKLTTPSSS